MIKVARRACNFPLLHAHKNPNLIQTQENHYPDRLRAWQKAIDQDKNGI
jgi:hypothetical protein